VLLIVHSIGLGGRTSLLLFEQKKQQNMYGRKTNRGVEYF
jgi:hypothetical protein